MPNVPVPPLDPESVRLEEAHQRTKNWKRWGPYLAERQWGTVREDYSANGDPWRYFPHEHARSRAYRWGEDGLLGFTDRECRLCFALALWNGKDPILKERLFGLTGPEGNHGEDVKECYFYLESTPTHSYCRGLYRYPQAEFPYHRLVEENHTRDRTKPEFELIDTGIFNENRYFDVQAEYAKASPDDLWIRLTFTNRGPERATLHALPTLWFRNTWVWGCQHEGCWRKPFLKPIHPDELLVDHATLNRWRFFAPPAPDGTPPHWLFTENHTNAPKLYNDPQPGPFKDAFHDYVIHGRQDAVHALQVGTKGAAWYVLDLPPGGETVLLFRLCPEDEVAAHTYPNDATAIFKARQEEMTAYYARHLPDQLTVEEQRVLRQACAGLLWSKQFYHVVINDWLEGDPDQPSPPADRLQGRNHDWKHLFSRDVLSMPDKWEYPWFAAWDLAFHMIPFARLDPSFAKHQLILLLREWYMHPNGQMPAYEFNFSDVNPPVHAWACWQVYRLDGRRDHLFLARVFQKLLLNFTWWVNRKDIQGKHLFAGGFLGLDNIGVFDRSQPLPGGMRLEQADGTAWMAFFCGTMLAMALELARGQPAYEDLASKFLEHFVAIADAMNAHGEDGLWDEEDGFYYDELQWDGHTQPLRIRSVVGLIPLVAVEVLEEDLLESLKGFHKRLRWFLENRLDLKHELAYHQVTVNEETQHRHRLLAMPTRERLERILQRVLDENEFLSPHGIRSLSRYHLEHPFTCTTGDTSQHVAYVPGDSDSPMFGGNSNWRGPVWFPVNYLLIEALRRYHHFYGKSFQVECPTGSGQRMTLDQVADELSCRLIRLFLPDGAGNRPCHGTDECYKNDPHWRDLLLFHEFFHGDNGRGLGACHQTGWTALVASLLFEQAERRQRGYASPPTPTPH